MRTRRFKYNGDSEGPMHSFSGDVAEIHGCVAAIVLSYLVSRMRRHKRYMHNGFWCYAPVEVIAGICPYLPRTVISRVLDRLIRKGILLGGIKTTAGYGRNNWYAFKDPEFLRKHRLRPVRFSAEDATKHGIAAAVLLQSLRFWIGRRWESMPGFRWYELSLSALASHLPFSKSKIGRALAHLVEAGVLRRRRSDWDDHSYQYAFAKRWRPVDGYQPAFADSECGSDNLVQIPSTENAEVAA